MNFITTELTQQVAQTARDFASQHIKPHVSEIPGFRPTPLHVV